MKTSPWVRTFCAGLLASLVLSGCGTSDEPEADQPAPTTAATGNGDATGEPPTEADPTPTAAPSQTEGDGDGEDDDTPATAGGGICGDLEAADVGAILGGATKGAALPGGGCGFALTAAKGPSSTFIEKAAAKVGGLDGAKNEATSSVEGEPQNVAGVGNEAFVVTGTAFGEPAIQGAGAVRVGSRIINVTLTQNTGMTAASVKAMVVKLLKLAAAKA